MKYMKRYLKEKQMREMLLAVLVNTNEQLALAVAKVPLKDTSAAMVEQISAATHTIEDCFDMVADMQLDMQRG